MVVFWKLAKEISPLGRGIKPKVKKDQHSVDKWSLKPLFYKIKPIDHSRRCSCVTKNLVFVTQVGIWRVDLTFKKCKLGSNVSLKNFDFMHTSGVK